MTKWMKCLCVLFALAATLFCSVGYAAVTGTLLISGQVEVEPPNAVYITEIKYVTYSDASPVLGENMTGDPIKIDFPSTKFVSDISYQDKGSVTFTVTVANGTSVMQYFNQVVKPEAGAEFGYNYSGIEDTNDWGVITYNPKVTPGQGQAVPPGTTQDFQVTITYNRGSGGSQTAQRKTLYQLEFTPDPRELTQQASMAVMEAYSKLLNNPTEYSKVQGLMYSGLGNNLGGYISNCRDYPADRRNAVNEALGEDTMQLEINGEMRQITVLLKQEDVCTWNNAGIYNAAEREERMIYFTADPLDQAGDIVPVFVCVFYKEGNEWVPVGQQWMDKENGQKYWILEGTATVCNRDGNNGTGNFQTGDWISTQEYFGVGDGATLTQLMDACRP